MRTINQAGIDLIKGFESLRLDSYLCPAGTWTIGYGHTGPDVIADMSITAEEAGQLLTRDLELYESAVRHAVTVPLSDNQFAALVSFAFNTGLGNFRKATLLKRLNAGDHAGVPEELRKWIRGGGKVLAGLVRRRAAECQLWRS